MSEAPPFDEASKERGFLGLPDYKVLDLPVCWLMLITECNVLSSCNVSLCSDLSSESGGPWPRTLVLAWWELRIKNSMINYFDFVLISRHCNE